MALSIKKGAPAIIALYVRQSVDKKDSISIEFQIETCKKKVPVGEEDNVIIYDDKGFSGKSTNRPEFQRLMVDIKLGKITKIIVYKVDRISRSLLDFLKMQEVFRRFDVKFVSCQEDFDTSTASGKMMMNMLMMFAEMERETIQKRITDNYYARGEKGLYLGGYAPFGYRKIQTIFEGKKTYTFEPVDEEATVVQKMYEDYAYNNLSLNKIVGWLNAEGIETKRKKHWNASTVSRMLSNPIYVKADASVYRFLKTKGATLNNPITDYVGENGCYVYGKVADRNSLKFKNYESDYVTVGLHKGIIDSKVWLLVQNKFESQSKTGNVGSGKLSWLQGLVKCEVCGYSCYVKRLKNTSKGKEFKYYYCRGRRQDTCQGSTRMLRVDFLEAKAEKAILAHLRTLEGAKKKSLPSDNREYNELLIQVNDIENRIELLISQIGQASDVSMKYINKEIEKLDEYKKTLHKKINELQAIHMKKEYAFDTKEVMKKWITYNTERRAQIAKAMIRRIAVDGAESIVIDFF